jgi:UDP-N-acetylmuramoyl-L-alanyl-D-glutamate--2,6-diaminopimelate ligase
VGTISHWIAGQERPAAFTTPEAPALHSLFAEMVVAGVEIAVMEVSSIGLAEHRVHGLRFSAAGFLNLSVDHLDYHGDMAEYGSAKRRLFSEHVMSGGVAIVNIDDPYGHDLAEALRESRPDVEIWSLSLTDATAEVRFLDLETDGRGTRGALQTPRGEVALDSPLLGRFNATNVAMAAAMALALGLPREAVEASLAKSQVRGRMELVANDVDLAIVVDYAHSPDALERVIATLKPLTEGTLWCVFGCGGDRDSTKRPAMGRAAAAADAVVITNDNPRAEDPADIAAAALTGVETDRPLCTDGPTVGRTWVELDRRVAIRRTIAAAKPGDTILIAGKGHETYQEICGVQHPFDDVEEARQALAGVSS